VDKETRERLLEDKNLSDRIDRELSEREFAVDQVNKSAEWFVPLFSYRGEGLIFV
jgi:hypothetical protein